MTGPVKIRRALISVSDKAGLEALAAALKAHGVELVSTGGTAAALRKLGHTVRDVAELTGYPEMMDGRVKTLHPSVHGGLLALRGDAGHEAAMAKHGIGPIDLLVVNLYPFEQTLAAGRSFAELVENIDIGGPAMIRSAAKNHDSVAVAVDPSDYASLIDELNEHGGATTLDLRRQLAAKAFARTAAYDSAIAGWLGPEAGVITPGYRSFSGSMPASRRSRASLPRGRCKARN
jgi:phosphoribosylaminoimidazolecarboxamide formyltransferase / IMP cyclohydrolase